jgi:acetyl esterase
MKQFAGLLLLSSAVAITSISSQAVAQKVSPASPAKAGTSEKAPALDPELQAVVDQLKSMGGKQVNTLPASEARKQPSPADAVKALLTKQGKSTDPEAVGNVQQRTIPGPAGPIPVRVYTPKGAGPFPVVVYFHGGGWTIADLDTYDSSARALTNGAGAVLISVDYRRAPEHKYPAAADDAYAATQWAFEHARELNGMPGKVAVAGESAGGNLATVSCLMARDRNGRMPVFQLLVYPIANFELNTHSYLDSADGPILTRDMMIWFYQQYVTDPTQARNQYVSPLQAASLKGLPPALVVTDGFDVLRSEGVQYAAKLRKDGVPVAEKHYPAMTHEFFGMGAAVKTARSAELAAASALKAAFAKPVK